ncbi:hypothetical protein [Actinoplanes sp. NPDC049681]|uniref:hypothetical protein n=1 Tax=Actinoplanes sp. NPDC049681 TaxID=3363905 RepID=UPI0037A6A95A
MGGRSGGGTAHHSDGRGQRERQRCSQLFHHRSTLSALFDHAKQSDASHHAALAKHQQHDDAPNLRETIADCDAKITRYRATLDAGGDPSLVAGWISETTAIKRAAEARLGLTEAPPERMSEEQIAAIVDAFGGLLGLLRQTDPRDRTEIYARLGLEMTYRPGTSTVLAEVRSKNIDRGDKWRPRTDTADTPTAIVQRTLPLAES